VRSLGVIASSTVASVVVDLAFGVAALNGWGSCDVGFVALPLVFLPGFSICGED
jgi:hypothetical protein